MKKKIFVLALLLSSAVMSAEVRLPAAIGDNMVLQQKTDVNVWGWGTPKTEVTVAPSWTKEVYKTSVDKQGGWIMQVPTPKAGGPFKITVSDKDGKTVIKNVLIGEVWMCSGQSNMAYFLNAYPGQHVDRALETILDGSLYNGKIRVLRMAAETSETPCDDLINGLWQIAAPFNLHSQCAIPYFFAEQLVKTLGVPVGIICNAWGGSTIEAWLDTATAKKVEGLDVKKFNDRVKLQQQKLYGIHNARVHPLVNYTLKGFLWYQGESNRGNPDLYRKELKAMVGMWRNLWKNQDLPFYYAQLAPYSYNNAEGVDLPLFVEGQLKSLQEIPNSGIVATTDVGDEFCIHPPKKKEVGVRFALMALRNTYGRCPVMPATGPMVKSAEFSGNKAVVTIDTPKGVHLYQDRNKPSCFELAGADKVFYPAEARLDAAKLTVEVSSDKVPEPVAVRYAFRNWTEASIFNVYGLPLFPWRSDNW